jgi:hypothetical protein
MARVSSALPASFLTTRFLVPSLFSYNHNDNFIATKSLFQSAAAASSSTPGPDSGTGQSIGSI